MDTVSNENEDMTTKVDLETIKAHVDEGVDLSDAEIDVIADASIETIRSLLACFGEDSFSIDEYEGDEGELIFDVTGGDLAILIGRHGRVLDSLQVVFSSLVTKRLGFHYPVVVDMEGYKANRRQKLMSQARMAAERAKSEGRSVRMKPMNPYERRIVHLALVDDDGVTTHSEGQDPERYVVITSL